MSFSNLLEFSLNFADSIVLKLFDFFESTADHAHGLRVNTSCGKDLVDLGILRLKTLLDSLKFLLEHEVSEASLLMDFVNVLVELFEQLLLLSFQVLELLKFDFILPFLFGVLVSS